MKSSLSASTRHAASLYLIGQAIKADCRHRSSAPIANELSSLALVVTSSVSKKTFRGWIFSVRFFINLLNHVKLTGVRRFGPPECLLDRFIDPRFPPVPNWKSSRTSSSSSIPSPEASYILKTTKNMSFKFWEIRAHVTFSMMQLFFNYDF